MSQPLQPEIQALCLLARTEVVASAHLALNTLLNRANFNWDLFWQFAQHHNVQPLVANTLQKVAPRSVQSADQAKLYQWVQTNAHRNLVLTGSLVTLVQTFQAKQVPILTYKGALLALTIYGEVCLRRFADIDIWVHPTHQERAVDILRHAGFELLVRLSWESTWVNTVSGVQVDLHQSLTPSFFPFPLAFEEAYARSRPVLVAGATVHTLGLEDNLLLLCVNLARDYWEKGAKLIQLCDIAELLRSAVDLDESAVLVQATQMGCRRMVCVGIALAQELLEAPVGEGLRSAIAADPHVISLRDQVAQQLLNADWQSHAQGSRQRFYWQVRERWREKIAYLFLPNEDDLSYWRRPMQSGLYYFLRPIRLTAQFLRR